MYVAVKGGEQAIDAAHRLLDEERRGDRSVPSITLDQIADACISAEVSDSKFESISIALRQMKAEQDAAHGAAPPPPQQGETK